MSREQDCLLLGGLVWGRKARNKEKLPGRLAVGAECYP